MSVLKESPRSFRHEWIYMKVFMLRYEETVICGCVDVQEAGRGRRSLSSCFSFGAVLHRINIWVRLVFYSTVDVPLHTPARTYCKLFINALHQNSSQIWINLPLLLHKKIFPPVQFACKSASNFYKYCRSLLHHWLYLVKHVKIVAFLTKKISRHKFWAKETLVTHRKEKETHSPYSSLHSLVAFWRYTPTCPQQPAVISQ